MAELIGGALLGAAVAELLKLIKSGSKRIGSFKSDLKDLATSLESLEPRCKELEKLYAKIDRYDEIERFATILNLGKDLVEKCKNLHFWNLWLKRGFSEDLQQLKKMIEYYCEVDVGLNTNKTVHEIAIAIKEVSGKVDSIAKQLMMRMSRLADAELHDEDANYQVRLFSLYLNKFVCAELGGASILVANRGYASDWETFSLSREGGSDFFMRVFNRGYIGFDSDGDPTRMLTYATSAGFPQRLTIFRNPAGGNKVRIRASNGKFLQAKTQDLVTADNTIDESDWGYMDPSVFELTVTLAMPDIGVIFGMPCVN